MAHILNELGPGRHAPRERCDYTLKHETAVLVLSEVPRERRRSRLDLRGSEQAPLSREEPRHSLTRNHTMELKGFMYSSSRNVIHTLKRPRGKEATRRSSLMAIWAGADCISSRARTTCRPERQSDLSYDYPGGPTFAAKLTIGLTSRTSLFVRVGGFSWSSLRALANATGLKEAIPR